MGGTSRWQRREGGLAVLLWRAVWAPVEGADLEELPGREEYGGDEAFGAGLGGLG